MYICMYIYIYMYTYIYIYIYIHTHYYVTPLRAVLRLVSTHARQLLGARQLVLLRPTKIA